MPPADPALARLLPHRGTMCLLDTIESASPERIACRASSHRAADHPLRVNGRLPALVAIEYAAQAMAAHGGLAAARDGADAAPGFLVAVRDVRLHVDTLDALGDDLLVRATRLAAGAGGLVYAFEVSAGTRKVAEGRATVALRAADKPQAGG
ncbi:MAG: 3-hydroxylacyl-ACP dehydratase [Burkholderiales bacterium]|nr:3-hydroxylacyl-ACP dehydratase [Burkholderiales bacterium]